MRSRSGSRSGSKEGMKRKRSGGATGQTPDGKQAKTGEVTSQSTVLKYHKPDFDWSQVTLAVLKSNGKPMSLEKYEEEKGNFVLKELDMTKKDGSRYIDEWNWFQDRVEVEFPNVASTELFWKLMVYCSIMSKSK